MVANRELIQAINQLDEEQQAEVLEFVRVLKSPPSSGEFDFDAWWERIHAFQSEFRAQHGEDYLVDSQPITRSMLTWLG
jgi:hypothetical protein